MWLASVVASGPSNTWQDVALLASPFAAVLAAVAAGRYTLRSATRTNDAQREKQFDDRVDAEIKRLGDLLDARNAAFEQVQREKETAMETVARLRIALIQAGGDPDSEHRHAQ